MTNCLGGWGDDKIYGDLKNLDILVAAGGNATIMSNSLANLASGNFTFGDDVLKGGWGYGDDILYGDAKGIELSLVGGRSNSNRRHRINGIHEPINFSWK